ncbi:disease resistance protein Pik-2-like isoform X2 [Miscanthus floridulus]|uniref:disease resistance protein Pik-2-like isoform X2 n=1 Tax=Miscanthus floridulus TaxID=154761 RepID=UPI00345B474A
MELVVGASQATMKSLLGKLGGLLSQEYTLIRGVRGDIQYINDELASMQAFLRDLSNPDDQDNRTKDWMKQIRDIAYDVEDCIDDFAHRLPHDSISDVKCTFIVMRLYELKTWWPRRQIATNISALKVRAQQIAERRSRYGVENPIKGNKNRPGIRSTMYSDIAEHQVADHQLINIKEPVGMNNIKELQEWVTKPHPERTVLSIIGFGGVGKTTIATALYRRVSNEFDCRALVTVSQNYDEDAVLSSILNQVMPQDRNQEQRGSEAASFEKNLVIHITSKLKRAVSLDQGDRKQGNDGSSGTKQIKIKTTGRDQLVKELKQHLDEKRYLLLIDDIWSAKTWESIRNCLPDNKKRSRIIVTTRFQAVGAACSRRERIDLLHRIDFLKENDSKSLFDQSVSESISSKHSEKVQEDKHRVQDQDKHSQKVQGEDKHSEKVQDQDKHSEKVQDQDKEIWKICGGLPLAIVTIAGLVACNPNGGEVCRSVFPKSVDRLTLDEVTRILDCCYNDLPGYLKTCSLYMSVFPKGWKISRKRLTRRWIAEGFVSEGQGLTEEEVAETYFNQLMKRKIIRPLKHSSNGKLKTFQVHDMVLEYIVSKSSEENFITVVGGHWMMAAPSNKVRRLSMQGSGSKPGDSTKGMNLSQVRSLTVFGSLNQLPFHSFNNGIIQVLDLEGWKGLKEKHLDDICKMLVLKYLSLRRTEITKIPSKIGKLIYLETLDIRETNVRELPKSVGQLKCISNILGGNKNPRKGVRWPQEKSKEARKGALLQEKSKDALKSLRILSGIEIVGESTAVEGLHQLTGLRKLVIYKLSIPKDGQAFTELQSAIEYLGSCSLQTLAINDEGSDFINSLDSMSAPPIYLVALELSGKLERPPQWITKLHSLNKLSLSMTVLRTDTLELLRSLPSLFSLTFSLIAANPDQDIEDILEKNKTLSDGEVFVTAGFEKLKLLRFFAPFVPKLVFSDNAMPELEMIEMRFEAFHGIFGTDTLKKLQEVHLRVNDHADGMTRIFIDDLKNNERVRVIVDYIVTA